MVFKMVMRKILIVVAQSVIVLHAQLVMTVSKMVMRRELTVVAPAGVLHVQHALKVSKMTMRRVMVTNMIRVRTYTWKEMSG